MHRFWDLIIEPVLTMLNPDIVVEIGSDQGKNTIHLLEFCKNSDAVLHAVDPLPKFDVDALKKEYGRHFVFHKSLSLNAIPRIKAADVFLIDGDHNWYTVFNELKLIEKYTADAEKPFPLVMVHDIGWPYGRRDLYYNPDNIPDKFRKPYKQKGIRPDSAELLEEGGLNQHLNNSIYESDLQSGVLTAIEDFLKETKQSIEFVKFPGLCGLGILVPVSLKLEKNEIPEFLERFKLSPSINQYFEMIEKERSNLEVLLSETQKSLGEAKIRFQEQIDLGARKLADKDAVIADKETVINNYIEINGSLKNEILSLQENQKTLLEEQDRFLKEIKSLRDMAVSSLRWKLGNALGKFGRKIIFKGHAPTALDELSRVINRFQLAKTKNSQLINSNPDSKKKKRITLARHVDKENIVKEEMSVSVIILNRNGSKHLRTLFESYLSHRVYQNVSFIVVDHASFDDSIDTLLSFRYQVDIEIILCDSNYSYSYSNNLAAKKATTDYLLFLNNDIIFESDPIPRLVEYLSDPNIGIVGLKLLYPEAHFSSSPQTSGIFSTVKRVMGYDTLQEANSADDTRGRVQHAGVRFFEDVHNAVYRGYNLGSVHGTDDDVQSKGIFPAVTAAAMVCRRDEFLDAGGFCEEYVYGNEDIDLCLTYMSYLKKPVVLADELSLVHDESATQKLHNPKALFQMRKKNWDVLKRRYGYGIRRVFHRDLVAGDRFWSGTVLKAAFAVTEADEDAKAGDYYTAMELACACEEELGWSVKFLARNKDWYDLEDIDVLIVMVDAYDLSKIRSPKPGLIKVAWMRNWFDRWADRDSFHDYDIFLCSCRKGLDFISRKGKKAHFFPIATNEKRFSPESDNKAEKCDYCFTGHKWSVTRDIEEMLNPAEVDYRFAVYGNNWDDHDTFGKYWRGFAPYGELASIYSNTRVVIDDAVNGITKPWGSMNSRVFDALASGALVVTNNTAGVDELFGDQLPTYTTREELHTVLNTFLNDENRRSALVNALRTEVLDKHTYRKRAFRLRSILTEFYEKKFRISIKVPVPQKKEAEQWGDYHFALGLKRVLVTYGHAVRIDLMPDWETPLGFADDVVIVLRGLSRYVPKPEHINIMWNISHPDTILAEEYEAYDHVFVASQIYAEELQAAINTPVTALLQCTDTGLFYPDARENVPAHNVLFVGNSRRQDRRIVKDAIAGDLPLSVYGSLWEGLIPEKYIKGTYIENKELRCFYSGCKILLNDHWPSMGDKGFISNRIFDAGACGTCIVSDNASGMETLFGDAITTYQNASELKNIVSDLLLNDHKRRACGEKMRDIVNSGHSFEHRVEDILRVIEKIDSSKRIEFPKKYFKTGELPNSPELVQDTV